MKLTPKPEPSVDSGANTYPIRTIGQPILIQNDKIGATVLFSVYYWTMNKESPPPSDGKRLGSGDLQRLLRQEIVEGGLQYGDQLPAERVLAQRYGVARGTVREALTRLAKANMVEIRRGSGTYVTFKPEPPRNTAITQARPLELIDARFALEPHICRLAVLHAGADDLERAEVYLKEMEASENEPKRFSVADMAFHTLLAESARNPLLAWMVAQISSVRDQEQWARMLYLTLTPETIRSYNRQHREIFEAIRAREPERAAQVMKSHLEAARLSLTRAAST